MINRGGEKISPREIDEVLLDAPGRGRSRVLRRAAQDVGRGSRGRPSSPASERPAATSRICWRSAKKSWPTSSVPSRSTSSTRFRVRPPARFSGVSWPQAFAVQTLVKIVIAGAGAIGGYIGARLAQAGADVVLHARGAHLQRDAGRAACASRAPTVTSRSARRPLAIWRRSAKPMSCSSASRLTASPRSHRNFVRSSHDNRSSSAPRTGSRGGTSRTHGGELDGLHLERVDPGRRHRLVHRGAPRRRVARILRHGHLRARRHSSHRGEPHQLR